MTNLSTYPILLIAGQSYDVEQIVSNDRDVIAALRLTKADGTHYSLSAGLLGCSCECGSFVFSKGPEGKLCKHLAMCLSAGLLAPAEIVMDDEGRVIDVKHGATALAAGLLDTPEEVAALQAESPAAAEAEYAADFRSWADAMDRAHAEEMAACGSAYDDAPGEADDLDAVTAEDRDFWAAESDRLARIEAMATYYAELGEAEYEAIREESYRSGLAFSDDADFELGEGVEILGHLAYRHRTEG